MNWTEKAKGKEHYRVTWQSSWNDSYSRLSRYDVYYTHDELMDYFKNVEKYSNGSITLAKVERIIFQTIYSGEVE
jgi:hypothetical protein